MSEPTLNEVIAHYGWTTTDGAHGRKTVLDSKGDLLMRGRAHEVWEWLKAKRLYPIKETEER